MQTQSFQKNNRAPAERLIFQYHFSEESAGTVDHRNLCAAVRAWAARDGQLVVAHEIRMAWEQSGVSGLDMPADGDVWKVKLFRWLDNKGKSESYRKNIESLFPVIDAVMPAVFREKIFPLPDHAAETCALVKEFSEFQISHVRNDPAFIKAKEGRDLLDLVASLLPPGYVNIQYGEL